jgi:hypothetical protein
LAPGEAVFNDGQADIDFRVESDAHEKALYVAGSTGNVEFQHPNAKISGSSTSTGSFGALGIGTTGPGGERKVDIRGELMVQSVGGESRHYFSGAAGDGDDGQYYIYNAAAAYKYNIDHHHHHQLLLKSSVLTLHQHFEPSTHL